MVLCVAGDRSYREHGAMYYFRILVRTKTFRWSGSDPSSLLASEISILRHKLFSVTAVGSLRYFAVYPITGGLSDKSIGVARRTDIKLAFRQVSDWRSLRGRGREGSSSDVRRMGALAVFFSFTPKIETGVISIGFNLRCYVMRRTFYYRACIKFLELII